MMKYKSMAIFAIFLGALISACTSSAYAGIQEEVDEAGPGETIIVASGLFKENIHIDKSLIIKGSGVGNTVIDGNQAGSVFSIGVNDASVNVILSDITIQNGSANKGGGIYNQGNLKMINTAVTGNSASWGGGGIFNNHTFTMNNSTVFGNKAPSWGAGVYNADTFKINRSSITKNEGRYYTSGGGIYNSGTLIMNNSYIIGNRAHFGSGIKSSQKGNAADWQEQAIFIMNQGVISGNRGQRGAFGEKSLGGGVDNQDEFIMLGGKISENSADDAGGLDNGGGNSSISGPSKIMRNQATSGFGGGIYSGSIAFNGPEIYVNNNQASMPSPSELSWYQGWGIYLPTDTPIALGGFNPALQITENVLYKANYRPNQTSVPSGSPWGEPGISYMYSVSTTDQDGDQVRYIFDWGDGEIGETDFVNSGDVVNLAHSWNTPGTYNIKAIALDRNGGSSDWSDALAVSIADNSGISIIKTTNGEDANSPPGPLIPVDGAVTWKYVVTTASNDPLHSITVADSTGVMPAYISGDANSDGLLTSDEIWIYQAAGIAVEGQYANIGTVTGSTPEEQLVTDEDPSHYYGIADQKLLCVSGYKLNGATNEGLSGWEIRLKNSSYTASTITDSNGYYEFCGLAPGLYTVTEIPQPGWTAIGGPTRSITLATNNLRNVNFTNDNSGGMPDIPEILDIEINPSEMDMVPPLTEKEVTFKATVKVPEGYEIILYAWMIKDLADPSKNVIIDSQTDTCKHNFGAGEYGKKEVRCLIKSKKIGSNDIVRAIGSKEFNVYYQKYKNLIFADWKTDADDNSNGIPNWFEYWKKDGAAPEINLVKHISEDLSKKRRVENKETYGYSVPGGDIYISKAAEYHYPSSILLKNTYFGTEVFGGDILSTRAYGINCISEVIAHEEFHRGVDENWTNGIFQEPSSDTDNLPDAYEEHFSHTDINNPDTYDLAALKSSEYSTYGDQEYMAMRNASGKKGFCEKDWSYPGCQKGAESLSYEVTSLLADFRSINLSSTNIDGNFTDYVLDYDENGYYDYLIAGLDINTSNSSYYYIEANLTDEFGGEITASSNLFKLSAGISRLEIPLEGIQINRHAVNGPYTIGFALYDQEGNLIDSVKDAHITAPYAYIQFEGQQGILERKFSDVGVDSNGDGIFEALKIDVGVSANAEGNFTLKGFLYDQENNFIASASASTHLLSGNSTVALSFNGTDIAYSKRSGPYLLRYLKLIAGNDTEIDFELDAYSTNYYETSDFLIQDARFNGVYTDLGADEDGDGLFEYLQIDADANITEEGDFIFVGTLYNSTGRVIDLATSQVHLNPGEHKVPLKFDGKAIFRNGANETFSLQDVILYRERDMSIRDSDMIPYITANYSFMLFESGINEAPNTPTMPVGQASGIAGTSYSYNTSATDPDGDQISYTFDWGDGSNSTTDLFDSGAIANATHIWNIAGIYGVKAKAVDSKGLDSEWSNAINVTIANNSCISGTKFNDTNSNATRDPGEAGLPGWTIRLTRPDGTSINATTDANGAYKFDNLTSGTYRVSEIHQSNWTQTYPAWLGDHIINVTDGSVTGVDFGNNYLPVPEIPFPPSGPASGIPGAQYSYSTSSTDPSGYQIAYTFDWGDGSNTTTGLFDSGAIASAAHIWNSSGIYQVRAMATDSKGASSEWSDPLEVDIAAGIAADKIGVFRNGPWYIDYNGNREWDPDSGDVSFWFGTNGDLPIAGDWNGDGIDEIGVFRNGPWYLDYNGNRLWDPDSGDVSFWFGTSGDLPIAGDWNEDGKDEIGVFRNGPWYLDYNGNREWDPASGDVSFWFGTSGDAPLAGDWNSDGIDEIGVFRNGPWYLDYNGNREWDPASGDVSFWFGTSGDRPVEGRWGSLSSSLGLDNDKTPLGLSPHSALLTRSS